MKIRAPKKNILFEDMKITVYSIGWFSLLVQRSPSQIRRWQRAGLIPSPLLQVEGDRRYYTAGEIQGYVRIFRTSNIRTGVSIYETEFKRRCWEFHADFRKILERHAKTKLEPKLPNEEAIERAFVSQKEEQVTAEARLILPE